MNIVERVRGSRRAARVAWRSGAVPFDNVHSFDAINTLGRLVALWFHVGVGPLLRCGPMDARQQRHASPRREQRAAPSASKPIAADRSRHASKGRNGGNAPAVRASRSLSDRS
jgi:hypothetical protein